MGKYALLIGVDTYGEGLQPLPAASRDVDSLREVLLNPQMGGFDEVKPLINPTRQEMEREIELWFQDRQPEDLVLLFFSGHGVKDDRRDLYFAAANTEKRRDRLVRSTAISARFIHECIYRCKAKQQVLILDSCFSGAFGDWVARDDGKINLKEQLGAEGRIVLTSTSAVDYSFEEKGKGADLSIYTRYLVEGIVSGAADEDEDGVITVEELHRFAARKVEKTSPAMSPKIITLKDEGYRIRLARSPQDDPKVKYRKEAERRAASGQFSIPAKRLLRLRRQELGISDAEAEAIEAEVLQPYRDYQRKLQDYEDTLVETLQGENPLRQHTLEDLKDYQQHLALLDQDIEPIQAKHSPPPPPLQQTATSSFNEPPSTFADYREVLATLISDLERLRYYSQTLLLSVAVQCIDHVLERVQSQSFSVAVVGEFKRGKSTFINALLGRDILPSDILPCSATLCRITYGLKPRVQVVYRDEREEEVAIDRLDKYVTVLTPESEEIAARIKEAIVYYPAPYCNNNVDIIDTPGLNNDVSMTEVTLGVLPRVDAAIMVMMAPASFTLFERKFLETKLLNSDFKRIIFVVNAIDRFDNSEDAHKHIQYVRDRIQNFVFQRAKDQYGEDSPEYRAYIRKIGSPKVFGTSALEALQAKQTGDGELLAKSRFPEFEAQLEEFVTHERGSIFLQVPINRLIASATEILSALNLRQNALSMQKEDFQATYEQSVTEIKMLRTRTAEEMKLIDAAAENVKRNVQPLILQLESELKQAVQEVINLSEITSAELRNQQALTTKLGKQVSEAMEKAAQKQAEKLQHEIDQGLFKEISRLQEFTTSVNVVLEHIEMQFLSVSEQSTDRHNTSAEGGYGGLKGAAIGAVGNIGGFAAGILLAAMIGLSGLPVTVVISVLSMLSGREFVKFVFTGERVENFKANYQQAVLVELEKQLRENPMDRKINEQISEIFATLKQKVCQEVDASLDSTQNTLTDLYMQRERNEVLSEQQQCDLNQMMAETQRILGNAQRLSKQLLQQVNC